MNLEFIEKFGLWLLAIAGGAALALFVAPLLIMMFDITLSPYLVIPATAVVLTLAIKFTINRLFWSH
jgi:fumarate reductase subunit D